MDNIKRLLRKMLPVWLLFVFLASCSQQTPPISLSEPQSVSRAYMLSAGEALSDAEWLISLIEETHPVFLDTNDFRGMLSGEYESIKKEFLANSNRELSVGEFHMLCSHYLSSLHDGHTTLKAPEPGSGPFPGGRIQLLFRWDEEALWLLPSDDLPEGVQVTAIGGLNANQVGETIDKYLAYENEAGRLYNRTQNAASRTIHQLAGLPLSEEVTLFLLLPDGSQIEKTVAYTIDIPEAPQPDAYWSFQLLDSGNVAVIISQGCVMDASWEAVRTNLASALDKGVCQIVFDIRENPGGNSAVWDPFLELIGVQGDLRMGSIRRHSNLAKETILATDRNTSGDYRYNAPHCNDVRKREDLDIVVLTGDQTFSSAMFLVGYVKDGRLGTVIGREPRNTLTHFGYPAAFTMPISKLEGRVSIYYWIRPDPSMDLEDRPLVDLETDSDEASLHRALDYLATLR